ncbi:MAG: hypothetical protein HWN65_14480 [Candidatus Helarchaeota archaeon]|nr:hypothetical protein [Candidatus Helarchaeota archaeon]
MNLEKKVEEIEKKVTSVISPYKKVRITDFKNQLFKEYDHLNPSNDISGVDYEIIRRRICRDLQISLDYFDDLIYDLRMNENFIGIQRGRDKKYLQIKKD